MRVAPVAPNELSRVGDPSTRRGTRTIPSLGEGWVDKQVPALCHCVSRNRNDHDDMCHLMQGPHGSAWDKSGADEPVGLPLVLAAVLQACNCTIQLFVFIKLVLFSIWVRGVVKQTLA